MSNFKVPKVRSEAHRRFIASLPCCVSGVSGRTQAAHIRKGNGGGMGYKPGDNFCLPLSVEEHAKQHATSEVKYWGKNLEAANELANALWVRTGQYEECLKLIDRFRWKMLGER